MGLLLAGGVVGDPAPVRAAVDPVPVGAAVDPVPVGLAVDPAPELVQQAAALNIVGQ